MQALKDQISPPQTQGRLPDEVGYDAESNWLFGADFTINEAINIKLILNDPDLYGILATVNAKPGSALEFLTDLGWNCFINVSRVMCICSGESFSYLKNTGISSLES